MLAALLLGSCTKGAEADLQYIKQARSAAAEWALINEQSSEGRLTSTYVSTMHKWLRDEIESAAKALSHPASPQGREMQALLTLPDNAPPAELHAHSARLKQIEDDFESA